MPVCFSLWFALLAFGLFILPLLAGVLGPLIFLWYLKKRGGGSAGLMEWGWINSQVSSRPAS